jgi:four helix bundle protein
MQRRLSHENLQVYQLAIQFLASATRMVNRLAFFPRGNSLVADQLRRAALSVPLKIAEAVGKPSPADNARHFAIARGSALECGAILDACGILPIADSVDISRGKEELISIFAMLSKLCRGSHQTKKLIAQAHHHDQDEDEVKIKAREEKPPVPIMIPLES